ncbi:MAG: PEPxxWA-CTERM sorting domain-containing protein [Sphingomonas sp.]
MPTAVCAQGFVNGGFEDGTATGWSETGGYRAGVSNSGLTPSLFTVPGGRSAVISAGYVDPNVGAALGSTVYSGQHSYRVEDTTFGGYASVVAQEVKNYTDSNIFFAWKAVLEGAHGVNDAATMLITLTDLTTGIELIRRQYNAASGGGGVDPRFTLSGNNYYFTPMWQIEQLAIDASLSGHDFLLSVLGSDCQPTGHAGYVYLDGFGAVTPPGGVPEPSAWAMMIGGFGLAGAALRRRRRIAVRYA